MSNKNLRKKILKKKVIIIAVFLFLISLLGHVYNLSENWKNKAWEPIILALITALFVAVVMMVIELILKLNDDDTHYHRHVETINTWLEKECVFCKSSISAIYPNRDSVNLKQLFQEANKRIYILTTNLESLSNYKEILHSKAEKKVDLRICTLHPNNAMIFNIFRSTGKTTQQTRFNTMQSSLLGFLETFKDRNCVRTYEEIPSMVLFLADNHCVVSLLFKNHHARDTFHIKYDLSRESDVTEDISCIIFEEHFDKIYESAKVVTVQEIGQLKYSVPVAKQLLEKNNKRSVNELYE